MHFSTSVTMLLAISASAFARSNAPQSKHKHHHHHHHSSSNQHSGTSEVSGSTTAESTATDTNTSSSWTTGEQTTATGTATSDGPSSTPTSCSDSCYSTTDNWVGSDFLSSDWEFFDSSDPTHGRVKYVDADTAKSKNLTYSGKDTFVARADSSTKLQSGGSGRDSVRINTTKKYTTHVSVLDLRHMPEGPGTWPAFWTVGDDWPDNGELDIIEGVNDSEDNLTSLHTSAGCTQPKTGRNMIGDVGYFDCNADGANGNQGCGVSSTSDKSFGPNFNNNGGGWYATERTESSIKVWFFARDDSSVPDDVRDNTGNVNPGNWGQPTASFVSNSCDLSQKFGPNKYVINLTLCGDWAGNAYKGGKDACNDYVNNNPDAYQNAYWDIARLTVYEKQ